MINGLSVIRPGLGLLLAVSLAACDGDAQGSSQTNATQYTVGGSVSGLHGSGLVLQNNSGDNLPISADGTFTFKTSLTAGSAYVVVTADEPSGPTQSCVVEAPTGVISDSNVSNIDVVCTDKSDPTTATVAVTITGVDGTGLVLQNNGGDNLVVANDGALRFALAVPAGTQYDVSVLSPPTDPYQDCIVSNGSGTTANTDIANIVVSCTVNSNPRHTISGSITGVSGSIVLENNGRDDLTITADGPFKFPLQIPQGSVFDVTTKSAAGVQSQTCQFQNARGVVPDHDLTDVQLTCDANLSLKVAVSGLSGSGLILQNNGGDNLSVGTNGTSSFPTPLAPGDAYAVTVAAQPTTPSQTCTATSAAGSLVVGSTVVVTCVTDQFTVGGTVTGLPGPNGQGAIDLVLQNNLGDEVTIPVTSASPTAFTFPTAIASGSSYSVTVKTQPGNDTSYGTLGVVQTSTVCLVSAAAGSVENGPVSTIAVNCLQPSGFAYVANESDSTVTQYLVDSTSGLLVPAAPPIPTGADPLCSTAFANSLYVCDRGSNALSVYSIDPNTGTLRPTAGSPVSAGLTAPTSVMLQNFDGGTALYTTSSAGATASGNATAFGVGATPDALSVVNSLPTGSQPGGGYLYSVLSGGRTVVDYYSVLNFGDNTLSVYRIDPTNGALEAVPDTLPNGLPNTVPNSVPTGSGPRQATHYTVSIPGTPRVDGLHVLNSGDGTITTFAADPITGALSQQGQAVAVGTGLNSIAQSAFVYATASQGLFVFSHLGNGSLTPVGNGPVATGAGPGAVAVFGGFVYVVNQTDETVSVFATGVAGGLSPVVPSAPIATGHGPISIVVTQRPFYGPG